jgi:murein tripeptide amidase MpaA
VVDCGIHAREWASHSFCVYLIHDLLEGNFKSWKNEVFWVVYPILNPDGYEYSWKKDRKVSNLFKMLF